MLVLNSRSLALVLLLCQVIFLSNAFALNGVDSIFSKICENVANQQGKQAALNKSLANLPVAITSVYSTRLNFTYSCPQGWVVSNLDSSAVSLSFDVSNPLYSSCKVKIYGFRTQSNLEASYLKFNLLYGSLKACQGPNYPYTEIYLGDSTYSDGESNCYTRSWWGPSNLINMVDIEFSFGTYEHGVAFVTSDSDFKLNSAAYFEHWYAVGFINKSTVSSNGAYNNSLSKKPVLSQIGNNVYFESITNQLVKLDAFNLKGQLVKTLFNGSSNGKTEVSLNGLPPINQQYILKLHSNNNQNVLKVSK